MQSFPEMYPQILALPITHQPLSPGFYVVRNTTVITAMKGMIGRGQAYLGASSLETRT